jgi:hypothetical protein
VRRFAALLWLREIGIPEPFRPCIFMATVSLQEALQAIKDITEKLEALAGAAARQLSLPGTAEDPEPPSCSAPIGIQVRTVTPVLLREASALGCLGREAQRRVDASRIQASALMTAVQEQSAPVQKLRRGIINATTFKSPQQSSEPQSDCLRAKGGARLFFEGLLCLSGATSCLHLPLWGLWLYHSILSLAGIALLSLPMAASDAWARAGGLSIPGFAAAFLLIVGLPPWSQYGSHRLALGFQIVNLTLRDAGASKHWVLSWGDGGLCSLAIFATAAHSYAAHFLLDLAPWTPPLVAVSVLVLLGHALLLGRLCRGLAYLLDAFSKLLFDQGDVAICWERWTLLCSLTRSTNAKMQGPLLALQVSFLCLLWQSCLYGARWSKSWPDIIYLLGNASLLLLIACVFLRAAQVANFHSQVKQHILTAEFAGANSWQLNRLQLSVLHANVSLSLLNERLTFTFLAREAYVLTGIFCFLYANSFFS